MFAGLLMGFGALLFFVVMFMVLCLLPHHRVDRPAGPGQGKTGRGRNLHETGSSCRSAGFAGGVFAHHVGQHRCVGLVRHMRTEADADVERPVEVELNGGSDLVHGLAFSR